MRVIIIIENSNCFHNYSFENSRWSFILLFPIDRSKTEAAGLFDNN